MNWATSQEGRWGECLILVEADIPALETLKARNIDLIVAFSDRVAVCEVKNHHTLRAAEEALFSSLEQCCESYDLVRYHLAAARAVSKEAARPFLFIPNLNSSDIRNLTSLQLAKISLSHVTVAGGPLCSSTPTLPNGHPLYLPVAIQSRLKQIRPFDRRVWTGGAQAALRRLVDLDAVCDFRELSRAVEYVRTEGDKTRAVRLPSSHVKGLDAPRLDFALKKLFQFGLVEIVGPFGIGKSAFARELISAAADKSSRHPRVATCNVQSGSTLKSLSRDLLAFFDVDPGEHLDDRALIDLLLAVEGTVWIQSYDADTAMLVKQLLEEVLRAGSVRPCRFLVESLVPLFPLRYTEDGDLDCPPFHVSVPGLDSPRMRQVLEANATGHGEHEVSSVAWMGNPRLALARWRSPEPFSDSPELIGEFKWIGRVFQGLDGAVARYLICLVNDAPCCGIREDVAKAAATEVFASDPPSAVRVALTHIRSHLVKGRMLQQAGCFTGTLRRRFGIELPTRNSLTLAGVEPSLAAYVRQTFDPVELAELEARTTLALEARRDRYKHLDVVLGFRRHELRPFCLSTFRNGIWGSLSVAEWLRRRRDYRPISADDAYLARCILVTERLYRRRRSDPPFKAEIQLGPPPVAFPLGDYLYAVMRTATRCINYAEPDLGQFGTEAAAIQDLNVAAESLCWIFDLCTLRARMPTERLREFLALFQHFIAQESDYSVAVRLLVYRRMINCMRLLGRDFLITRSNESWLFDLFRCYFALAVHEDNMWHLTDMTMTYFRLTYSVRAEHELRHALSILADDGNPHVA